MNSANKSETLHVNVSPEIREEAEIVLNQMGLSTPEAINMFLSQIIVYGCIPFQIRAKIPNETTRQAMFEAENEINLKKFDNAYDMFKELGI